MSDAERALLTQLQWAGLPEPVTQFRFAPPRRWRADFCWPEKLLMLEIDGGGFVGGRHSRGTGIERDAEKQSAAAIAGYRCLRVTPRHIESGEAVSWIEAALRT